MNKNTIGVIGAVPMARGVAELAATQGLEVILVDPSGEHLEQCKRGLETALQHRLEKWAITEAEARVILGRIRFTRHLTEIENTSFVIECTIDNLQSKKELFRTLDQICDKGTILGSNTSTLSITEMAAATYRAEKVIGTHFLSPVTKTMVVEIVRGLETSDETVAQVKELMHVLGKTGVEVYESTGYVTTRLIVPMINEAIYALMEGVASAGDIDTAIRLGFEMSRGPLELADHIGLETVLLQMDRMWKEYGDLKYRPAPLLRKLVRAGHVGVEAGQGFFRYDADGRRTREE